MTTDRRRPRTLAALVVVVAAVMTALPGISGVTPGATAAPTETALSISAITPVSVQPGKTLRISGRFSSDTELRGVTIRLEVGTSPFLSRSAVTEAAASPPFTTPVVGAEDELGQVKAGGSRRFDIAISTDEIPLVSVGAGVYPMRVVAVAGPLGGLVNSVSTFLPWVPEGVGVTASRLLMLWPIIDVPRRDATGAFTTPGLNAELGPRGRLGTLTSVGADAPVTWVVDPSLLSDVEALGTQKAEDWLSALPGAVSEREVAVVPFGDPDLAAVAAADRVELLRRALARGEDVTESLLDGQDVRTDLGWPADGAADATTIDGARHSGAELLLLDETTTPLVNEFLGYTPSGRWQLTDPDMELLLADRPASALMASPAKDADDILLSRQRYLAETLLHALEIYDEPRLLVVAPPRRWDPDPGWARELVTATRQATWLDPVTLEQAVRPSPPAASRTEPSIPETSAERQLPSDLVLKAAEAQPDARRFRAILTRPALLARPIEDAIYTSLSTAWRADHEAAATSQDATIERLTAQRSRVRIVSRGGTLSDDRGLLPVTIRNQLDQKVVVGLSVTSTDPLRLRVDVPGEPIKVAAEGVESVSVELDAVTSGRLTVDAQILTPNGHAYSDPVPLPVDVRAYGQVALIVFGAAAALMVMAAVVRVTRRIRRSRGSAA